MIFAINLIYTVIYSYSFSVYKKIINQHKFLSYFLYLFPVWTIWLIICGGQYKVGTDYEAYYNIFETCDVALYYKKFEYFFAYIVEISNYLDLPPQTPFYIFYLIGYIFFIKILTKIHHDTSFIFIILYISISTVFNNQLNGLRQYIALYICTYALLTLQDKKGLLKFSIYTICATFIHSSSLLIFPLAILKHYPKISYNKGNLLLILSIILGAFGGYNYIISYLTFLVPSHYQHYIGGVFDTTYGFSTLATKLIFIPFYFYSLTLLKTQKLNEYDLFLFKLGLIGYSIRIMFLSNFIFNRIGNIFLLVSMLPLYFLLRNLYIEKKYKQFAIICLFFISFYLSKVLLFPSQEYLYNSIYLKDV